jgi:hypothetical protein
MRNMSAFIWIFFINYPSQRRYRLGSVLDEVSMWVSPNDSPVDWLIDWSGSNAHISNIDRIHMNNVDFLYETIFEYVINDKQIT